MNRWIGIGRLVRDCELKYSQQGTAICKFTIAINRKFKRDEVDFLDCVVWQKQAENCANYIGKGSQVALEGRLQIRPYEDKNGNKRKATEVIADSVKFLDKKGESKPKDDYSDIGREVDLSDIGMDEDDEIPF